MTFILGSIDTEPPESRPTKERKIGRKGDNGDNECAIICCEAEIDQVKFGSEWQEGPNYLRKERGTWPVTKELLLKAQTRSPQDPHISREILSLEDQLARERRNEVALCKGMFRDAKPTKTDSEENFRE